MNVDAMATRLYTISEKSLAGFRPDDFLPPLVKDGVHIVSPIRPPEKSKGGVIMTIDPDGFPGTACLAFQVVCAASLVPDGSLKLRRGDCVVLRNAHLEPLQPNLSLLAIKAEHVLAILPDDSGSFDDACPDVIVPLVLPSLRLIEKQPETVAA